MRFSLNPGKQEDIPKGWHARLVNAIASRNPQKAEKEIRKHVEFGQDHDREFLDAMNKEDFTPPPWLQG